MGSVHEWYLGGMVDTKDAVEKPKVSVMDAYEITDELKGKLNALVADEFLAFINYRMCRVAMKGNKQHELDRASTTIGWDEMEDHFENLVNWMQSKGITVVTSVKEMERITNCTVFEIKDGDATSEIVDKLIKSEEEAIAAYEKVLDDAAVKYDLRTLLSRFLTDERRHLKRLTDVKNEMTKK